MHPRLHAAVCLAVVACVFSPCDLRAANETVQRLGVVLERGDKRNLSVALQTVVSSESSGAKKVSNLNAIADLELLVSQVDWKGEYQMEARYKRIVFERDDQGKAVEFDTANAGDDSEVAERFKKLIDIPFDVSMTRYGKVALSGNSKRANREIRSQFEQTMESLRFLAALPRTPVAVGDSWPVQIPERVGSKLKTEVACTLLSRDSGNVRVGMAGTVSGSLSGTVEGELVFDGGNGWIKSGKVEISARRDGTTSFEMKMIQTFSGD